MRPRRIKRQFDYEHADQPILDPKIKFKVDFFFNIIDQTLSSLRERFEGLERYNNMFGFLYNIYELSDEEILKNSKDLHLKLEDVSREESDINGIDLCDEIKTLKLHLKPESLSNPQSVLQYIFENQLLATFPNISIALRILLTLPVSVASGERTFSKLKIIKNYLRSTMLQDRLNDLAIIAIESEILDSLNIEQTVSEFAENKARKIIFL